MSSPTVCIRLELYAAGGYRCAMEIGTNIERIRQDRGMSIADLSEEVGVDPTHLRQIEAGQDDSLSPEMLVRIARGLAVEVGALFGEDGEIQPVELEMLAAPENVPGALAVYLRNNHRNLTLDERVYLERVLSESESSSLLRRQGEFYDFWNDQIQAFRGSPSQDLLRFSLGIHPDYGPETRDLIPQVWAVAEVIIRDLAPAAIRDREEPRD